MNGRGNLFKFVIAGVVILCITAGVTVAAIPAFRDMVSRLWGAAPNEPGAKGSKSDEQASASLYRAADGKPVGLRLSAEAAVGMKLDPAEVTQLDEERPLAPQVGWVQYPVDRIFNVPARFAGELEEITTIRDTDSQATATKMRPRRHGDKVVQGDLVAVVLSQPLGQAKSALVDAIVSADLSLKQFRMKEAAFYDAAYSLAGLMGADTQRQRDELVKISAHRSLLMWKLSNEDIDLIEGEAEELKKRMANKAPRTPEEKALYQSELRKAALKWARVEVRVPKLNYAPDFQFTIVEVNHNIGSMVDPVNTAPIFKICDMSRLQVDIQIPREYLPIVVEQAKKGRLNTFIQFQEYPYMPPLAIDIFQVDPVLDSQIKLPTIKGHLPNKENKFIVGQGLTATINVKPPQDTVEIPTAALNEVEGEALVFVETSAQDHIYTLKRVAVVQRFNDVTLVRCKLSDKDKEFSDREVEKKRRRLEPLAKGEKVVTRGVLQMTAAYEALLSKDRSQKKNN